MLLKSVELNNLGPYNGRHHVELSVSNAAPIILIYGENERGKTSLANAIRWCLYGRARGRGGRDVATVSLMNWEALDSGAYNMSVRLEFEHGGADYRLTRHVQSNRRPTRDADLDKLITLEVGGHVRPTEQIKEIISGILHEDISRFFFFDGEMLNEYEDLLNDPERAPELVRKSIEQILGLPALERARADLEELRVDAERKQLQETKKSRENEKLIQDAQQKEEELAAIDGDIEQNNRLSGGLEEQRAQLRAERERYSEIQAEVKSIDEKELELADLTKLVDERTVACRQLLQRAWWLPLENRILQEYTEAEQNERSERDQLRALLGLRQRIDELRTTIEKGACKLCGQVVDAGSLEELRRHLAECEGELGKIEGRDKSKRNAADKGALLRGFMGVGTLREVAQVESEIRRARLRSGRVQRQLDEIKRKVRGHERSEIQRVEREYDECVARLKEIAKNLETLGYRRVIVRGALERLRQKIHSLPEADRRLAAEASVFQSLERLFAAGVETFRDQVRKDVEAEATQIHHTLSNEPGYDQLRITAQYGLVIVNKEGRTIFSRSAGSEQILALSLIGALNRCATREAPVIMDTPFGRLDVGHRANILKFAPSFGRQVILLVQSGEFDRNRDMQYLKGKVSRELRIQRDGASDRSTIEPVRERIPQ